MSQSNQVTGKSVAAFLLLPQFHLCVQGLKQVVPLFTRILAVMFAQANLIPNNHPATRNGTENVRPYSFRELLGEGWFTLRNTRATPYQWGMYMSVIMMIVMMTAGVVTFSLNTAFSFTQTAQAQFFDHPRQVYEGVGVGETGLEAVESISASPNPLFDTRYAPMSGALSEGASTDWALMVLDKVLRQGAVDEGGALQRGLRGLMVVYNGGLLLIGAVIIFWMILSIVVDTAKTGQIGGGRHNMVWIPIRTIFALGLMIPLGTTGFSSGQFMIMKFAEWGSNFGTRGWSAYVASVGDALAESVVGTTYDPDNMTKIIDGVTRIKLCQITYNAMVDQQANGNPDFAEYNYIIRGARDPNAWTGKVTETYRNRLDHSCGTVTYTPPGAESMDQAQRILDGVDPGMTPYGRQLSTNEMLVILGAYRNEMRAALTDYFTGARPELFDGAQQFACSFAIRRFPTVSGSGDNAVRNSTWCATSGGRGDYASFNYVPDACDVSTEPTGGHDPGHECLQDLAEDMANTVINVHTTAAAPLREYLRERYVARAEIRGWAGMGNFYAEISKFVETITRGRSQNQEITIAPTFKKRGSGDDPFGVNIRRMLEEYDDWWVAIEREIEEGASTGGVPSITSRSADLSRDAGGSAFSKFIGALRGLMPTITFSIRKGFGIRFDSVNPLNGLQDLFYKLVVPDRNPLLTWILSANENELPAVIPTKIGWGMFTIGIGMQLSLFFIQGVFTISILGVSLPGLGLSTLFQMAGALANALIVMGLVAAVYLPLLPVIRVAFAVLTWITSVFEAVMMIPIAALSMLSSGGEGLTGGQRNILVLWLNVLLRPMMTVVGFVGAGLIYNTFIIYLNLAVHSLFMDQSDPFYSLAYLIKMVVYSVVYVVLVYTAANSIFKMVDLIPNAAMKWMGSSGDTTFTDDKTEAAVFAGAKAMSVLPNAKPKFANPNPTGAADGGSGGGGGGGNYGGGMTTPESGGTSGDLYTGYKGGGQGRSGGDKGQGRNNE